MARREEKPERCYFALDLTARQRDLVLAGLGHLGDCAELRSLVEAVETATRRDGDLPPVIDWAYAERKAAERGSSVPDWLWDMRPGPQ